MSEKNNGTRPVVMRGLIVGYASLIHLTWGLVLPFEPAALNTAPIHHIGDWFQDNNLICSAIFLLAGILAWVGSLKFKHEIAGQILGVPQLMLIFISAGSCIQVIMDGIHPDGTINGHLFFIAQTANSILLAPFYMFAVYAPFWKAMWRSRQ